MIIEEWLCVVKTKVPLALASTISQPDLSRYGKERRKKGEKNVSFFTDFLTNPHYMHEGNTKSLKYITNSHKTTTIYMVLILKSSPQRHYCP